MMAFSPPKSWNPNRFRSVVTSLGDQTIVDQTGIPWCTAHKTSLPDADDWCWKMGSDKADCVISRGGLDHKWWVDV